MIHKTLPLPEGYDSRAGDMTSTSHGYTVEVMYDYRDPIQVCGHILDNRWRRLHFKQGPIGVPTDPDTDGLLSYHAAQALRHWFMASAQAEHHFCLFALHTRLVEHKILKTKTTTAVGIVED